MSEATGQIVRSTAGHDKGLLFCVVGEEAPFLLLANGKQRKLAAPKKKKDIHVERVGALDQKVLDKLIDGNSVSDRELRMALAAFKGGNHAWQKTI